MAGSAAAILALSWLPRAAGADTDPTVHQIYEAAEAGHFDKAQQMMDQVLRDHPSSGKAHYVQAELYAREGKTNLARAELAKAEQYDPGLTHISPRSVHDLKLKLGDANGEAGVSRIPLASAGGTLVAPVVINNAVKLNFTVDSGAADVSIPADVFSTLVRSGTVTRADVTGSRGYVNASGDTFNSQTFVIRLLKVGNVEVANVDANVAPAKGPLLLGQSFLKRFKNWSIDNTTRELVLQR